jgi:hypothetical protein
LLKRDAEGESPEDLKKIISIASFVLIISVVSILFFYKQHGENKTTYIPTGYKENPLLQAYY